MKKLLNWLMCILTAGTIVSCDSTISQINEALSKNDFAKAHELLDELYMKNDNHGPDSKYSKTAYVVMKAEADFLINNDDNIATTYLVDHISKFDLGVAPKELKVKEEEKDKNNEEYIVAANKFNDFCSGVVRMALNRNNIPLAHKVANLMVQGLSYIQSWDYYKEGHGKSLEYHHYYCYEFDSSYQSRIMKEINNKIPKEITAAISERNFNFVYEILAISKELNVHHFENVRLYFQKVSSYLIMNNDFEVEQKMSEIITGSLAEFTSSGNYNEEIKPFNELCISIIEQAMHTGNKTYAKKIRSFMKNEYEYNEKLGYCTLTNRESIKRADAVLAGR